MEYKSTLQVCMDSLFGTKKLTSWTIHDNNFGSVLTIRFRDTNELNSQMKQNNQSVIFKPKTKSQMQRDVCRKQNRKRQRIVSEGSSSNGEMENVRSEENNFSTTGISPLSCNSDLNPEAELFCMASDSESLNHVS